MRSPLIASMSSAQRPSCQYLLLLARLLRPRRVVRLLPAWIHSSGAADSSPRFCSQFAECTESAHQWMGSGIVVIDIVGIDMTVMEINLRR